SGLSYYTLTLPTAPYTLSLHDALPISPWHVPGGQHLGTGLLPHQRRALRRSHCPFAARLVPGRQHPDESQLELRPVRPRVERGPDRKSTRLNSSHVAISYAVFCLKKNS